MRAERYLTIEEAAFELAELTFNKDDLINEMSSLGIPDTSFENMKVGIIKASQKDLCNQIMSATKLGELLIRNPANKLPYIPKTRRDFFEKISVTDINYWLEKCGLTYRLAISKQAKQKQLTLETECVIANNESEQEIYMLFDQMNKQAIAILFDKVDKSVWKESFNRASRNGLKQIREDKGLYNPAKVGEWLVSKGIYTQEHVNRKLANNLPKRNLDKKHLITGDVE